MKFRGLFLSIVFVAAFPALASACACSNTTPGQCTGLAPSDVVFTGTVTEVQLIPPEAPAPPAPTEAPDSAVPIVAPAASSGQTPQAAQPATPAPVEAPLFRYHFKIDERFAGPDQQEIDIFAGGDDGDCGYKFKKGAQYVVFTQTETDGRLFATICNGTRPAGEGEALIPQLRAMRDGKRVASVFGVLRQSDPPFLAPDNQPDDPIPSISLKLRSQIDRFQSNSGPDGVYTFYDVHGGTYNFTANLPPGTELTQKSQSAALSAFSIPEGACYEYDVYALPTGHIDGTVLGPDGKPLPIASLELYRVGAYADTRPGYWGFQGATGVFQFDHVGPGNYVLVYNRPDRMDPNSPYPRAFYPGVASIEDAKPITLKDGKDLHKVTFKVTNGYPSRQLRVRVKWTGVRPPGDVTVTAKADKYENPSVNKVADGLFTLTLLEDANYTLSAWEDLAPQKAVHVGKNLCTMPARLDAPPVTVTGSDANVKDITITFPRPDCIKQ